MWPRGAEHHEPLARRRRARTHLETAADALIRIAEDSVRRRRLCARSQRTHSAGPKSWRSLRGLESLAVTNDVIESAQKHYVTIWFRGVVDDPTLAIVDTVEIAEAMWCDPASLPSPRHVYFDNLISGRSWPPLPSLMALTI